MKIILLFFVTLFVSDVSSKEQVSFTNAGVSALIVSLCSNPTIIQLLYETGSSPEEENKYHVTINRNFSIISTVTLKFDSEATITLIQKGYARITAEDDNKFFLEFYKSAQSFTFKVQGVTIGIIPYLTSMNIDGNDICKQLPTGYLDSYIRGYQEQATSQKKRLDTSCGRRKIFHTELIVNGASTKPGDWPWHVAIYRLDKSMIKYICGGTLVSKSFVLTAAHCVTIRGVKVVPHILSVVLAKYNLIGGDVASQEREISDVIVHQEYKHKFLDNDIALLQLKAVAVFDDYIQPVCIWNKEVENRISTLTVRGPLHGTVVGWGLDHTDSVSAQLLQATLPILPEATCLRKNPVFYSKILNDNKFCAGFGNGTSPCNGDSGGSFAVFVPDDENDRSPKVSGSWYVRGIVSVTVSRTDAPICDPEQYVVFTDVAKYQTWIENYINDDLK